MCFRCFLIALFIDLISSGWLNLSEAHSRIGQVRTEILGNESCRHCHISRPSTVVNRDENFEADCESCHDEKSGSNGLTGKYDGRVDRELLVSFETLVDDGIDREKRSVTKMIYIPGGKFIMGYNHRHPDERPEHITTLKPFMIDLYEVTNYQYKQFVDDTKRTPPRDWQNRLFPPGKEKHPVAYVTWFDAYDYCAWVGKRLPVEAEWEKAARGEDGRLYPWGNEFNPTRANTPQSHSVGTVAVGSFSEGRSPYGLYDMSGNVWEWTMSWATSYAGSPIPDGHYFTGEYKVLRGGSWVDCSFYRCGISALTFNRGYFRPVTRNKGFGFRCASD